MTLASDQKDDRGVPPTACRMLELRDKVIGEWADRVRQVLRQTESMQFPIRVNTLPVFYDHIVQAIILGYPVALRADGSSLAAEHGAERARMTNYDHQALISEYQIFRWAVLYVLDREGVTLSVAELLTINTAIDDGMREAVNAFTQAHAASRKHHAAALTHDLRGLLAATAIALDIVTVGGDPDDMRFLAQKARASVRRVDDMVQDLLGILTSGRGGQLALDTSNFDIQEVIAEVISDVSATLHANIRATGIAVVGWWDRSALQRAVENLVGNAIKYGKPDADIIIQSQEYHERLDLSVHNEGEPIPREEWECIFQTYHRARSAKRSHKRGAGVGLSYVRAVAESHGGSVTLESTVERGTTFFIDVPVDCRRYHGKPTLL